MLWLLLTLLACLHPGFGPSSALFALAQNAGREDDGGGSFHASPPVSEPPETLLLLEPPALSPPAGLEDSPVGWSPSPSPPPRRPSRPPPPPGTIAVCLLGPLRPLENDLRTVDSGGRRMFRMTAQLDRPGCGRLKEKDQAGKIPYNGRTREVLLYAPGPPYGPLISPCNYQLGQVNGSVAARDWLDDDDDDGVLPVVTVHAWKNLGRIGRGFLDNPTPQLLTYDTDVLWLSAAVLPVDISTMAGERFEPQLTGEQVDAQLLGPGEHSYDHFLRHCSLDKVALEPGPWQRESVSSIDLDQVLADAGQVARVAAAGAAAAAAASGTGEGPEAADRAWRMCLQLAAQGIEKELYNSLGSLESHLVLALPEAVLQKAAAACPGAPVLQQQQQQQLGGEGGGGDALRALTTNLRAAFACVNTKNDFLGRPKGRACGSPYLLESATEGSAGRTVPSLAQVAIRALGLNVGLRDTRTPDGSPDPTSGLSGAQTCFNGPQSWLLGWLDVVWDRLDFYVYDINNDNILATPQTMRLPALGSQQYCLARIKIPVAVLENDNNQYGSFWIVFRMSDPSLGLYSAQGGQHQVVVYRMDQQLFEQPSKTDPPALLAMGQMAADGGAAGGAGGAAGAAGGGVLAVPVMPQGGGSSPVAYLCVRYDGTWVDTGAREAAVDVCVATSADDPCCSQPDTNTSPPLEAPDQSASPPSAPNPLQSTEPRAPAPPQEPAQPSSPPPPGLPPPSPRRSPGPAPPYPATYSPPPAYPPAYPPPYYSPAPAYPPSYPPAYPPA